MSEIAVDNIERMFGYIVDFRHYKCDGVIFERTFPYDTMIYECGRCGEWSPDLLELVLEVEESDMEIRYAKLGSVERRANN